MKWILQVNTLLKHWQGVLEEIWSLRRIPQQHLAHSELPPQDKSNHLQPHSEWQLLHWAHFQTAQRRNKKEKGGEKHIRASTFPELTVSNSTAGFSTVCESWHSVCDSERPKKEQRHKASLFWPSDLQHTLICCCSSCSVCMFPTAKPSIFRLRTFLSFYVMNWIFIWNISCIILKIFLSLETLWVPPEVNLNHRFILRLLLVRRCNYPKTLNIFILKIHS